MKKSLTIKILIIFLAFALLCLKAHTVTYIISGSDFKLFFEKNDNLFLNDGYVVASFNITDGILNGTESSLWTHKGGGKMAFRSLNNSDMEITFDAEVIVRVSGCLYSQSKGITTLQIKNGNRVVISWEYGLPYPNYVPLFCGLFGSILIIVTPIYVIKKLKEGEYSTAIAYGMLMAIIGLGFVIFWLW